MLMIEPPVKAEDALSSCMAQERLAESFSLVFAVLQRQQVTFWTSSCSLAFTSKMVSERSIWRKYVDFLRFTLMYTHLLGLSSLEYRLLACAQQ